MDQFPSLVYLHMNIMNIFYPVYLIYNGIFKAFIDIPRCTVGSIYTAVPIWIIVLKKNIELENDFNGFLYI